MELVNKIKNILSSKFARNVGQLSVGSIFKLIIAFVGSIFITRLLGVEDYGVYVIAMSFASILLIFTRFSFTTSLTTLLAEGFGKGNKQEVAKLIVWFVKNLFLVNVLTLTLIILVPWLASLIYPNISQLGFYVQIYLLSIFFSGLFYLITIILQVMRKIGLLSALEVTKDFLWRAIAIIFLLLGLKIFGVVLAQLIGMLVLMVLSASLYYIVRRQNKLLPNIREIINNWRSVSLFRNFKFTTSISFDNSLASLYTSLPVFFVGLLSSETQAGLLGLAIALIAVPKSLAGNISKMLSSVLPERKSAEGGTAWVDDFRKTTKIAVPLLALVFLGFGIAAYWLIPFIYGVEFTGARGPLVVLVILNLFNGFTLGIGPILRTIRRVKLSIYANLLSLVLMALAAYYLVPLYGAVGAVLAMLAWRVVTWLLVVKLFKILKYEYPTK